MLSDHENLLSTFGKDSQSSNRKQRQFTNPVRNRKLNYHYQIEPKSRYEQILSQRKTLMMLQKTQDPSSRRTNASKKLKTQSDIDYLNTRIRKSISGIAETICKSKIKNNLTSTCTEFEASHQQRRKVSEMTTQSIRSHKQLKPNENKWRRPSLNDKQNFNLNNFQQSKRSEQKNLNRNQYLKNSTKKKGKFFNVDNQCPIKTSFSIDLNSQKSSMESSRKQFLDRKYPGNHLNNIFGENLNLVKNQRENNMNDFPNKYPELNIGKQMEQTLKKQFKQLAESNYTEQPKLLETKGNRNKLKNPQFLFYEEIQSLKQVNSPNFNKISLPKNRDLSNKPPVQYPQKLNNHKLILALMKQIELDYDLRHAKHMFSGIQEPYYAHPNDISSQCKWQRLNAELKNLGLQYPVQTIKKIFLPTQQEIDPFLSVGKPHQELIFSLIYAYEAAQIHWQQNIYQQWQHWDLRDIDLTIQNIDRDRKGQITFQDLAAFISMQSGREYKNRDVVLIYKRLINGFSSRKVCQAARKNTYHQQKHRLKFRALIECLIKPFSQVKVVNNYK